MSAAQVTEAHLRLANQLVSSPPSPLVLATLIADSEAKAVAEWKDSVHLQGEAIDSLLMECDRLRAELAAERKKVKTLRESAVNVAMIGRVWLTVWRDKFITETVQQFERAEGVLLATLATEETK